MSLPISKILRIQLLAFFVITALATLAFYYQGSLPDNYLSISSESPDINSIVYFFSSFIAWIGYYTGPWFLFPFVTFAIVYAFIFAPRTVWYDIFQIFAISASYLVFFYFFIPEFLGQGVVLILKEKTSTLWLSLFGLASLFIFLYTSFRKLFNIDYKSIFNKAQSGFSHLSALKSSLSEKIESFEHPLLDKLKSLRNKQEVAPEETVEKVKKTSSKLKASDIPVKPETEESEEKQDVEGLDSSEVEIEEEDSEEDTSSELEEDEESDTTDEDEEDLEAGVAENLPALVAKNLLPPGQAQAKLSNNKRNEDNEKYYSLVASLSSSKNALKVEHPDNQYFEDIINRIEDKLAEFRIDGHIINVLKGPVVDTFELELGSGVKVSKVTRASEDLSLALYGAPIRIVYPMLGRTTVGIEVPRNPREIIYLSEVLQSDEYKDSNFQLPVAMGKNAFGETFVVDLASMPHMLVAGATGAGKSVFINTLLVSLLVKRSPSQMKLILIDPKQLELALYAKLPHLIMPVVTDAKIAAISLLWACQEMERRYSILKEFAVRNINGFNDKLAKATPEMLARIHHYYEDQGDEGYELPYLVIIVDEFADLILTKSGKEIETNICRLAAKARAAGIHLVLATQRPSVDVITGLIKSNFPTRVSFRVTSSVDSRTILNTIGAEKLLGKGDMLYKFGTASYRVHSSYVDEEEIEAVTEKLAEMNSDFNPLAMQFLEESESESGSSEGYTGSGPSSGFELEGDDEIYNEAVKVVVEHRTASASMLQRRLRIGYNRAANLIEQMEEKGVVGPAEGSKRRKVLVSFDDLNS